MQKGNRFNTYTLCKSNQSLASISKNDISFTKIGTRLIIVLQILLFLLEILLPAPPFRIYTFINFRIVIFTYKNEKKSFIHTLVKTCLFLTEEA